MHYAILLVYKWIGMSKPLPRAVHLESHHREYIDKMATNQITPTARLAEIAQQSLALTSFISATASTTSKSQRDPFDVYTDQELMDLFHEIADRQKWMEIECRLYERFLMKAGRAMRGGSGAKGGKTEGGGAGQTSGAAARKEIHPDCAIPVKIDIVSKEMDELKDEQVRTVAQFDKECANLQVRLVVCDLV